MARRPRDSQRQRVYDAERQHSEWLSPIYSQNGDWNWTTTGYTRKGDDDIVLPVPTMDEVKAELDRIIKMRFFKNRWPLRSRTGLYIRDGRGRRSAYGSTDGSMGFPRWSRTPLIYCHELAHVVTNNSRRSHGRVFCANYLTIVKFVMGKEAAKELKEHFKTHRVKYTLPAGYKPTRLHRMETR